MSTSVHLKRERYTILGLEDFDISIPAGVNEVRASETSTSFSPRSNSHSSNSNTSPKISKGLKIFGSRNKKDEIKVSSTVELSRALY